MLNWKIDLSGKSKRILPNPRSRSGSMLIFVLVMLAVAIILITSALTITLAARQRYYKDSEYEQAGLTATSAAQMIAKAAANGAFGDIGNIESLATNNTKYNLTAKNITIPGLSGTSGSNTYATFGWYPDSTSRTYISVTVQTTLDAGINGANSQEEVMVLLKKKEIVSEAFGNLITLGIEKENGSTNNVDAKLIIGEIGKGGTVVVHGNMELGMAQQQIKCQIVFTGCTTYAAQTFFQDNVIYYGDNAGIVDSNGSAGGMQIQNGYNLFFFREARNGVFAVYNNATKKFDFTANNYNTPIQIAGGIYLLNSDLNSVKTSQYVCGKGVVLGPNSSTIQTLANPTNTADLQAAAEGLLTSTEAAVNRTVLQTSDPQVTEIFANAGTAKTNGTLISNLNTDTTYPAGTYKIDLSASKTLNANLNFDLTAGDVNLYLFGQGTLNLKKNITFLPDQSNQGHVGKIYLMEGADISIDGGGIMGSSGSSPWVYVYGNGQMDNKVSVINGKLEGYIGLYGANGTLTIAKDAVLYCRYEGAYLIRENPYGNDVTFPFCPKPTSDEGGSTSKTKLIIAGYVTK